MQFTYPCVRFNMQPTYCYYQGAEKDSSSSYRQAMQDSLDRMRGERAFLQTQPKTHLNTTTQVFEECRQHDITVIFGNLGRHPLLLTYFLDFVFTSRESIGITSEWDTQSPYQVKPPFPTLDFLLVIEPYFGYSVIKPPHVSHLVILTSHLVLNVPTCHMTKLFLTPADAPRPLTSQTVFPLKPPVFHQGKVNQIPSKVQVLLDVTNAKSAHEAYLKILTGREMARGRLVTIQTSPRDHKRIQTHIKLSRDKALKLGWKEDWICEEYLVFLEYQEKPFVLLQKPRISH